MMKNFVWEKSGDRPPERLAYTIMRRRPLSVKFIRSTELIYHLYKFSEVPGVEDRPSLRPGLAPKAAEWLAERVEQYEAWRMRQPHLKRKTKPKAKIRSGRSTPKTSA